jgi:hypothetical protein
MAREFLRLQFTFTNAEDARAYGTRPFLYDEYSLVAKPMRELAELEDEIGMSMADMLNGVRDSRARADAAATWVAMRVDGWDDLPPFSEYNPHTMMIEWAPASEELLGKSEPADTPERPTTVTLPSLPEAV